MDHAYDWLWNSAPRIAWTLGLIGGAYVLGIILNTWVAGRLVRLAARTSGDWDDILVAELRKRIPWWAVLIGLWLAIGHWPLSTEAHTLARNAVFTLAALSVTMFVSAVATLLVTSYSRAVTPPLPVTGLTRSLMSLTILGLGLLVILNGLGVSITPVLTALGVGGLAVALALQEPLSNLFAGVFVTLSGQIRVGDYIRLTDGLEGYVLDFGWRSARIRQLANNLVIVPNSKLAQAMIVNYTLPEVDMSVVIEVGVDYGSDLDRVERVTIDVASEVMTEVPGGVPAFTPFIRFHTFGDSSIQFSTILRVREFTDQYLVKHEFVKRLQRRYQAEGITIPFPTRTMITQPRAAAGRPE